MTFLSGSLRGVLKFQAALEADCKETPQELSSPGNALCVGEERGRHLRIREVRQGRAELLSSQMELLSASTGSPTGLYLLQLQQWEEQSGCPSSGAACAASAALPRGGGMWAKKCF